MDQATGTQRGLRQVTLITTGLLGVTLALLALKQDIASELGWVAMGLLGLLAGLETCRRLLPVRRGVLLWALGIAAILSLVSTAAWVGLGFQVFGTLPRNRAVSLPDAAPQSWWWVVATGVALLIEGVFSGAVAAWALRHRAQR